MTLDQLLQVMPRCPRLLAQVRLPHFEEACAEFAIDTPKRVAAFLAQLAHESAEWRHFEELWGPTHWQLKYEGSKTLGNTEPGDGIRFKGRGAIQLTGRSNYRAAGKALGIDLEASPKRASDPDVAFRTAGWYWRNRGLSPLADAGLVDEITRRINGPGMLGKVERAAYYAKALAILAGTKG